MPWYWILIILSAIVGQFEAMHALNKARSRAHAVRDEARRKRNESQSDESGSEQRDNGELSGRDREEREKRRQAAQAGPEKHNPEE